MMMNDTLSSQSVTNPGPRHRSPGRRAMRDARRARERVIVPGHRLVATEHGFDLVRHAMPKRVLGAWNKPLTDAGLTLPRSIRRALAGKRRALRPAERDALATFVRA